MILSAVYRWRKRKLNEKVDINLTDSRTTAYISTRQFKNITHSVHAYNNMHKTDRYIHKTHTHNTHLHAVHVLVDAADHHTVVPVAQHAVHGAHGVVHLRRLGTPFLLCAVWNSVSDFNMGTATNFAIENPIRGMETRKPYLRSHPNN